MEILKLNAYRLGIEHGRAAETFEPPADSNTSYELYELGYVKGYNELLKSTDTERAS